MPAHIDSFCAEFKTVAYASQAAPNGGYLRAYSVLLVTEGYLAWRPARPAAERLQGCYRSLRQSRGLT